MDNLDLIAEVVGTKKTKLVSEIVEEFLSDPDAVIQSGDQKWKVKDILKKG